MNKFSIIILFILISFTVCKAGDSYVFNWSEPDSLDPPCELGWHVSEAIFASGPVSLVIDDSQITDESKKAHFVSSSVTHVIDLRIYDPSQITVSVPDLFTIIEISFEESQVRNIPLEYNGPFGSFNKNVWKANEDGPNVTSVTFDVVYYVMCTSTVVKIAEKKEMDQVENIIEDHKFGHDEWYTLQGVKLPSEPSAKGMYILHNRGIVKKILK